MEAQKTFVTGAAGFIGYHLCMRLLSSGQRVVGLDNLNDYYDVDIKKSRLARLKEHSGFSFLQKDLTDKKALDAIFEKEGFEVVVHLAAQAGVRYSIQNPYAYMDSNLTGFLNILEACRLVKPRHLIFASSSSVYGANKRIPF